MHPSVLLHERSKTRVQYGSVCIGAAKPSTCSNYRGSSKGNFGGRLVHWSHAPCRRMRLSLEAGDMHHTSRIRFDPQSSITKPLRAFISHDHNCLHIPTPCNFGLVAYGLSHSLFQNYSHQLLHFCSQF